MMAGHYVVQAISTEYLQDATNYFEEAVDTWMYPYEAREHFSQRMTKAVYGDFSENEVEEIKKAFVLTEEEMKKAVKENPTDFRQYLFLGQLYNSFYRITGDPEKLVLAEDALNKAIELSPTNQQGYWYLAEVRLAQGDIQGTVDLLEQAVELDPRVGNSHWFLAMAYSIAGENDKAIDHINKAEEAGYDWKRDSASLQRVIAIYEEMGDDQELISLYSDILELNPNNADYWYSLAASYANMGEYEKAREAAEKVREIDPSASERIDEFINQLP
jgi:tetratricopeptide (TPR) repeat protein